jgi:hypothetical protein
MQSSCSLNLDRKNSEGFKYGCACASTRPTPFKFSKRYSVTAIRSATSESTERRDRMHNYMKAFIIALLLLGILTMLYNQKLEASGVIQQDVPQVAVNTSALQVLNIVRNQVGFELLLKNISSKNINGYSVSVDDRNTITSDLTIGDQLIRPGTEFKVVISRQVKKHCVIRHVMFEDGTGNGDPAAIAEQQDRRNGAREQFVRIASLLRPGNVEDLAKLKSQIEALPTDAEPGRSVYVTLGMRNAKEDVLTDLNKIGEGDTHAGVARIRENYNRRVLRLGRSITP